ncbi:ORF6N domain-containing protein [Ligilactobacillus salivarius]|uniref:ORF6N domain-containing protein n=1 Tax=Ligilactobacillus salivarius TaxID=1624 RepID=UPI00364606A2
MNELKILGTEKIGSFEFTGIEGGFGKNKKAMLVRDIAVIHGKEVRQINQAINMNRKRFKDGIDVIDFLNQSNGFRKFAEDNGLIGSNRTQHVYLLSERGYAKLLKILEDDKAWEIYDELVDNYFNMRLTINTDNKALLADKKLEIMEENAKTRKANLLYKIAMATKSRVHKESLLNQAGKVLTGESVIPAMEVDSIEYTATEVAKRLGILTKAGNPYPAKVGEYANKLELKAEQPGSNKYGRWIISKSKYSAREVAQWVYFEPGVEKIEEYLKKLGE